MPSLLLYAHPHATIRTFTSETNQRILDACKSGRLLDVVEEHSEIPLHFLEFFTRCSLTHGYVYAFKFGIEELLEEFLFQSEELNEGTARITLYNIAETFDYCILWILSDNNRSKLLQYLGFTIHRYEYLAEFKKFPALSTLHYIFKVHEVLLEVFGKLNLHDIAGIILQYHLGEFTLKFTV